MDAHLQYKRRDYAYGEIMLMLRTAIGLTQEGLACLLGVSRRAVGEWEAGNSHPKADHLKELIALGVKQQAFAKGNEAEEIRALWKAARQKVPLDEHWLSALLSGWCCPHLQVVPSYGQTEGKGTPGTELVPVQQTSFSPPPMTPEPRVDWGDAPAITSFYGREEELAQLSEWIVRDRCRVVSVLGMGGIGKSVLSVRLMHTLAVGTAACPCPFEVVIFRSLRDAPALETLLDSCLQVLSPHPPSAVPVTLEQRLSLLLSLLRKTRTLLVLDNLECLLLEGNPRGQFRPDFLAYGQLLHRVAETAHQSCLLITSREKPADLRGLSGQHSPVCSLRLTGLDAAACKQLFVEKKVIGMEAEQERLISLYGGNPLALKIVAEIIVDLFSGEIAPFLVRGTALTGPITTLLDEQFARLSALEQSVLYWLSIVREPVTIDELIAFLIAPHVPLLEAVDSLRRRSLIECGKRPGSFTLQSVVMEYLTGALITEASTEIRQGCLARLIEHGLVQAKAREYVRQTQERLLISPLLAHLQVTYPQRHQLEERLVSLLEGLRCLSETAQGYGPANLIALLRVLRGHLSGLDLSSLSICRAYLQGIEMQDTHLSNALLRNAALTEALDAIWGVAISCKGTWWAAGSRRGEVRVWHVESQTLYLVWQAHTDIVPTLAFSPDEHILATGSWDGTIKLWDLGSILCSRPDGDKPHATLLWMGEHSNAVCVALSPDGRMLTSGGRDTAVKLWDTKTGTNLQMLQHPGYVYALAWSPDGHLLATGAFDGSIRLWLMQKTAPATCLQTFSEHTNWVMGLAFAPDGKTLASGSWDHTVKLWDIASGRMLQTLSGHMDKVHCLAWSPDGRTLASCSVDKTIRLWDVGQECCRAVLQGHTSAVYDLCFTPESGHLLSGSEDGTLRVWDVQSGQCIRIIQGYSVCLSDVDWSPDGTQLVSGGTDGLVIIWDAIGVTKPRVLCGHSWIVWSTGWSRDGKFLASSEHAAIHLWDPASGACIQRLRDPVDSSAGVVWSPDGQRLAYGTLMHGVQVCDVATGALLWPIHLYSAIIRQVAWSPDGTRLAAGGDDGTVYEWDATNGRLRQQINGHQGIIMRVAWRSDSRLLATCGGRSGNSELFIWDMQTGECVRTFMGHAGIVNAVVWCHSQMETSEDQLISGDSHGMLRWWDVQSGECVNVQEAHQGAIQSLKVSPDGRLLASCGDDGAIRIWNLCSGGLAPPLVRTLRRDRPYERLNITGLRGLNEAQIAMLRALGATSRDEVGS